MPAVMQQVDALSLSDKMRMMKFLVQSIEKVVARQEARSTVRRVIAPDPALRCEVHCNLFDDDSSLWENA